MYPFAVLRDGPLMSLLIGVPPESRLLVASGILAVVVLVLSVALFGAFALQAHLDGRSRDAA